MLRRRASRLTRRQTSASASVNAHTYATKASFLRALRHGQMRHYYAAGHYGNEMYKIYVRAQVGYEPCRAVRQRAGDIPLSTGEAVYYQRRRQNEKLRRADKARRVQPLKGELRRRPYKHRRRFKGRCPPREAFRGFLFMYMYARLQPIAKIAQPVRRQHLREPLVKRLRRLHPRRVKSCIQPRCDIRRDGLRKKYKPYRRIRRLWRGVPVHRAQHDRQHEIEEQPTDRYHDGTLKEK